MYTYPRLILDQNGDLDPTNIDEYIARGGYASLEKALTTMSPDQVLAEVKVSGSRGRGGAGFPTGVKWETTRKAILNSKLKIQNSEIENQKSKIENDQHPTHLKSHAGQILRMRNSGPVSGS
jgi:NADH:ubiquinone oxidoreductase subunit F (NADH-binding)